jgi:telomere length regulation protein
MADLFSAVSTTYTHRTPDEGTESFLTEVKIDKPVQKSPTNAMKPETPHQALEILKNEPDFDSLISTLTYLKDGNSSFSITSPSPLTAQLVRVLVSKTIPTYWNVLRASENGKKSSKQGGRRSSNLGLLLSCLRSVTGLNAVLLNLKQSIQQSKETKKAIGGPNIQDVLKTLLEVLSELLEGTKFVEGISNGIWNMPDNSSKQRSLWNEFLSIIGGKIIGISAEAEDIINELNKEIGKKYWTSDSWLYSKWISSNISSWAQSLASDDGGWKYCAEVLSKAFRLGHTGKKTSPCSPLEADILQIISLRNSLHHLFFKSKDLPRTWNIYLMVFQFSNKEILSLDL